MVEHYPDTVKVDSSSLSVATKIVMARSSIGKMCGFYPPYGGCEFESHRANERNIEQGIRISDEEVYTNNVMLRADFIIRYSLFSYSTFCECDEDGESWRSVKPLPSG